MMKMMMGARLAGELAKQQQQSLVQLLTVLVLALAVPQQQQQQQHNGSRLCQQSLQSKW
jgi:surfactin synthase thioesterase subunit